MRNYYSRPLLVDVHYEERINMIHVSYSGDSIIERNLDGYFEQQILDLIKHMTMAVTAFKIKGNGDKNATTMLVSGFTSQLKGCWDNILTKIEKATILNAIKVNPENGQQLDNATTTLLYTIVKHFVGDPI